MCQRYVQNTKTLLLSRTWSSRTSHALTEWSGNKLGMYIQMVQQNVVYILSSYIYTYIAPLYIICICICILIIISLSLYLYILSSYIRKGAYINIYSILIHIYLIIILIHSIIIYIYFNICICILSLHLYILSSYIRKGAYIHMHCILIWIYISSSF